MAQNHLVKGENFVRQALRLKPGNDKALRLLAYIFLRR